MPIWENLFEKLAHIATTVATCKSKADPEVFRNDIELIVKE